jgi:hypothetical protein
MQVSVMTDLAFILALTALIIALVGVITSCDARSQRRRRSIPLSPFGLTWRGLYDGLDVPEHLRRALRPSRDDRKSPRAPGAPSGPYR